MSRDGGHSPDSAADSIAMAGSGLPVTCSTTPAASSCRTLRGVGLGQTAGPANGAGRLGDGEAHAASSAKAAHDSAPRLPASRTGASCAGGSQRPLLD